MFKVVNKNSLGLVNKVAKWHFNYYLLGKPSPLVTVVYLTHNCNFKCVMCNFWRDKVRHIMPIDIFKNIVDDVKKSCYYIDLAGGEPTIVPDLMERLKYASDRIPYVHMVSNGFLINEKRAKQLGETGISEISISIDGIGKTHEEIRGVKDAYDKALNAVKYLQQHAPKVKIVVNTVLGLAPIKEMYQLVDLTEKLGVMHKFQPTMDHPEFNEQHSNAEKKGELTKQKKIEEISKFIKIIRKKKHVANSDYYLAHIPDYFKGQNTSGLFKEKCKTPYFYLEVTDDQVFPCATPMNWKNGFKLNGIRIRDFYDSKAYKEKQKVCESCTKCSDNMYICYVEPRINFPISSFLKYNLLHSLKRN
jgi:MoaA/NifB/PqqE/SkfB family radical SAM enzyme